jgi:hypothetical protein
MAVSIWAVLGIVLLLIGVPFLVVQWISPYPITALAPMYAAVGAGVAFGIVGLVQAIQERWADEPDEEAIPV